MDNTLLSTIVFVCIVIAYLYKHLTTKNFNNSLTFWSITLVMFATFSLTTWMTPGHDILEKIMYTIIFCGPLSVICRMRIQHGSLTKIFLNEKRNLKLTLPTVIYYLLYGVLTLGITLFITFTILKIFFFNDSIFLTLLVNRITIFLDWTIITLLLQHILFTKEHEEKIFFWFMCLIAAIVFLIIQYNIHGVNFWNIPAIEPTISSICCSLFVLIAIGIRKKINFDIQKPAQGAGFYFFISSLIFFIALIVLEKVSYFFAIPA